MRDGVLVEGLALYCIAVLLVERLRAEPRVEDDHAITAAPRPSLGVAEQPRADALALLAVSHRHLLELQRVRAEPLERHRSHHAAVEGGAEMPAMSIVGQLFRAEGEAERPAQDGLAQAQSLGVEGRAVRRLGEVNIVSLGHGRSSSATTVNSPRASSRAPLSRAAKKRMA